MPARQPFTALCRTLARPAASGRADLHIHTTSSDGQYTPADVIDLARRTGLSALAVTDHDTIDAVAPCQALAGSAPEIIPGVEISAEHRDRELHLLGYFFRLDDAPLLQALERLRGHRTERFWSMVARLEQCGIRVDREELGRTIGRGTLGRRNLADLLVRTGQAGSVHEVFQRFLGDRGRATLPKVRLPVEQAIALVRGAGGVASWAHPPYDASRELLLELRGLGLEAVEASYPGAAQPQARRLRAWAGELGLAVTGGSDCHGPGHYLRAIGACGITAAELHQLRQRAMGPRSPCFSPKD
jgi:predicted metal-dependent phosphoesterase TrpH